MVRYLRNGTIAATLGAFALLCATTAGAAGQEVGGIEIVEPWARATASQARAGGAFVTLKNGAAAADRLLSVASPAAETAELHTHIREGDVMKMRPVDAIDLPAGQTVTLAPGGLHVMLIGLKAPLKQGESFPLTLTFEKAGTATVQVSVKSIGASGAHEHKH